jgi:hypothetical protein
MPALSVPSISALLAYEPKFIDGLEGWNGGLPEKWATWLAAIYVRLRFIEGLQ